MGTIKNKYKKEKWIDKNLKWMTLFALIASVSIVPLIVRLKAVQIVGIAHEIWFFQDVNMDFFSYYKAVLFMIVTALAIISFSTLKYNNEIQIIKTKINYPIYLYFFLILLSTLFAEHNDVALGGFVDRYEGMWVLLGYVAMMYIAIHFLKEEKQFSYIMTATYISAAILGMLGLTQLLGFDFFATDFGKDLMLSAEHSHLAETLKFKFSENNIIYMTLFNPNYVGSYLALILPLTVSALLFTKTRKIQVLFFLLNVVLFINLIGSRSRAGLFAFAATFLIMLFFYRRNIYKNKKVVSIIAGGLVLVILIMNFVFGGVIIERFKSALNFEPVEPRHQLHDMKIDGHNLTIDINEDRIKAKLEGTNLSFVNREGEYLDFVFEQPDIIFQDEHYAKYAVELHPHENLHVLKFNYDDLGINFFMHPDFGFQFINEKGEATDIPEIESWGFEDHGMWGSSRGFIWSRSLPLIKDTLLLGHGPDTYAIYFPQNDHVGKIRYLGGIGMIVDKPHNLYIQTAINTGLLSLIAKLAIFIMYMYSSAKLYYKGIFDTYEKQIGVALFFGVLGYLISGLINDSVVSVAPVFWVLLGMGVAINTKLKGKEA
ncbi:MAG: O-antigen ligase family protein [Clostridiales bacterium]|nr:O-antigen ligase family protein [Clostridiales bacterium]